MQNNMREDWIEIPFNEATLNFDGKRKPLSSAFRVNFKGEYPYYGACEIIDYVKEYLFEGDYLLIGEDGANLLSKSKPLAFIATGKFWVNNHAHVVQPKNGLLLNFLAYQFNSLHINEFVTGTAQPKLNQNNLNKIPVGIPPLPIQRAIVSKIEALFSDLDNGIANFKKAREQLKIYRQAVLKKAFEGGFTNENVIEGGLPIGWEEKKVSEIANTFGGFAFKSSDFLESGDYQVLRMGNVRPGVIRLNESPVFLNELSEQILNKALLKIDDVIITQTGTKGKRDYGFSVLINKPNLLLNQRIAAIRCKGKNNPKYLLYFTWTDAFKNQFFANETGNVGQGNVGMKAVTDTLILVPPTLQEQTQIVQEIESRLSVCDKVEQSINESIIKAEALRQSILKKAFEGKLLSQAEIELCKKAADYEPASELLKKIQAEKWEKEQEKKKLSIKMKSKK